MNKIAILAGMLLILITQASGSTGATEAIHTRTPGLLRVLFIGNSFTYFNDTPRLFQALVEASQPDIKVETQLIASGGAALEDHWDQGDVKTIATGDWDFVALQE